MKNYYDILELQREASFYDIREAYRRLTRKHHPDRSSDKGDYEKFIDIAEAYGILSSSQIKYLYDVLLNKFINMEKGSCGRYSGLAYYKRNHEHRQEIFNECALEVKRKAEKSAKMSLEDVLKEVSQTDWSEKNTSSQAREKSYYSRETKTGSGKAKPIIIGIIAILAIVSVVKLTAGNPSSYESSSNSIEDEYVIPYSDTDYISVNDRERLISANDPELIRLAINEIYARHGLTFSSSENQEYFDSKTWYTPDYSIENGNQVEYYFNDIERANIEELVNIETYID